jgi:hypothetical protein
MSNLTPKQKYNDHKARAKRRGILFAMTFDEWFDVWTISGKWDLRGSGKGKYCMCRVGDTGGYTIDNVFIGAFEKNSSDANKGRVITEREKSMISKTLSGRKFTDETLEKMRLGQLGKKHTQDRIEKRLNSYLKTVSSRKLGEES